MAERVLSVSCADPVGCGSHLGWPDYPCVVSPLHLSAMGPSCQPLAEVFARTSLFSAFSRDHVHVMFCEGHAVDCTGQLCLIVSSIPSHFSLPSPPSLLCPAHCCSRSHQSLQECGLWQVCPSQHACSVAGGQQKCKTTQDGVSAGPPKGEPALHSLCGSRMR